MNPAAVFAEIVHVPQGRVGNVIHRPILRAYEIPWAARGGASKDSQITIADLTVAVVGKRVVLRSRRLGREVIPRLTSAHAYGFPINLALYRFLASLQSQDQYLQPIWWWGALEQATFLPRVVAGRMVLSRARWLLEPAETDAFLDADSSTARSEICARWQRAHMMPRLVTIGGSDRAMMVDLASEASLDSLASALRRGASSEFREFYPEPSQLLARGSDGRYVHELYVPFVREALDDTGPARQIRRSGSPGLRSLEPTGSHFLGSEWIYAKLYAGSSSIERLLHEVVSPFVGAESCVDRWFFIRYGDPEWHLRVRLHGRPDILAQDVLPRFSAALRDRFGTQWLWRATFDVYEPEIDRYGGAAGMNLAERFFHADSDLVLDLLDVAGGSLHSEDRWRLALRSVALLLEDFSLSLPERRTLMDMGYTGVVDELGVQISARRPLARKYRQLRPVIDQIILGNSGASDLDEEEERCFRRRGERNRVLVSEFRRLQAEGSLSRDSQGYLLSLVHMALNRIFRWAHLPQEIVVYDLLAKGFASVSARSAPGSERTR
jgi:thiopeptide-type bacteriocin biosynthesis protein